VHNNSSSAANHDILSDSTYIAHSAEQITKRGAIPSSAVRDTAVSLNNRKSRASTSSISSISAVSYIQSPPRLNGRRSRVAKPYYDNRSVDDDYSGVMQQVQHDTYR
jgi:hypothetical protein